MISEQDKQAILNGAYAVSRRGHKAKYLGETSSVSHPYCFVYYDENGKIIVAYHLTKNFIHYKEEPSTFDVVGLWQDKPEPFDLERALAGELVKYSDKPCYVYQSNVTGLFWVEAQDGSFVDNDTPFEDVAEQGMWKEPEAEPKTVTLTLPRPLKEPRDKVWYINTFGEVLPARESIKSVLNAGRYFGSEEDAQAWVDAMRNSRA